MNLRAHHLLCIQKFTGHGYDETFTEHMTNVVSQLKKNPESEIVIAKGCDYLCSKCPNMNEGKCISLQKVSDMDSKVLNICGLTEGEKVKWCEASKKAYDKILKTKEFENVCADCQWYELCSHTDV